MQGSVDGDAFGFRGTVYIPKLFDGRNNARIIVGQASWPVFVGRQPLDASNEQRVQGSRADQGVRRLWASARRNE